MSDQNQTTLSDACDAVLAAFKQPVFAAVSDDGRVVMMPGRDWTNHPLAGRARWIGGQADHDVVRAALTMLKERAL